MVREIELYEKIKKIGNSHYITIRSDILELLGLEKGDFIKAIITKIEKEDFKVSEEENIPLKRE